jgi:hypothetical protein
MSKDFNITGLCLPHEHYMADVSAKLKQVVGLIEKGRYFTINRPRQYGKTTTLYTLADILRKTGEFMVFNNSFEGVGDNFFTDESIFAPRFTMLLSKYARLRDVELGDWLMAESENVKNLDGLSDVITKMANRVDKKIVLLIDEVDKSSNNQLFVSFLAMLRNKYLARADAKTFHSVVLAGVHDVKTLKLKLRPDEEHKFNSPWNIAAEFKVDMNLQIDEIVPMLKEYAHDKNATMDAQLIAERLFYYTSGYPFLVSKLCKMLDEEIVPSGNWTADDVEFAVKELVREDNTNFESMKKNLNDNPELYNWVYHIAIDGNRIGFSVHNPLTQLGVIHGFLAEKNKITVIHNRIYNEVIAEYMRERLYISMLSRNNDFGTGYKNSDKTLNMEATLLGFQTFMKKEYSKKDRDFLEKNGRLVFLAFIKPIINGNGYDFKEVQISEEKRLDVVITYLHQKFVAELKLWYGQKAHEEGLQQLSDYLDSQGLDTGYLIIFDHSAVKNWQSEWIDFSGKKIFMVWV